MAPTSRPDYKLNLDGLPQLNMAGAGTRSGNGSASGSPIEQPAGSGMRFPLSSGMGTPTSQSGTGRAGAGSPSKEYGSRLFPKRAREIQVQEGLTPSIWGPPPAGSGHSTPLRETIPESPGSDSFPDFDMGSLQGSAALANSQSAANSQRRARAGTVPSRFPAVSTLNGMNSSQTLSRSSSVKHTAPESGYSRGSLSSTDLQASAGGSSSAALLSRLRAGSTPQRASLLGNSSPFGSSFFASNWLAGRERASTLQSIRSSDAPSSQGETGAENDVRTLDYLGLDDSTQHARAGLTKADMDQLLSQQRLDGTGALSVADMLAYNAFTQNPSNRYRSFSVNAAAKYANAEPDEDLDEYSQQGYGNGTMTPATEAAAAQAAAIHEAVRQHNLDVQAFANFASANRPRARTAGVLDSPSSHALRSYLPTPSRLDKSITAEYLHSGGVHDVHGLTSAVQGMNFGHQKSQPYDHGLEPNLETPTRSLWLGNVPASTTVSSLNAMFSLYGNIDFARVLTHKSCGFVNFETIQSAIAAKAQCNGREIFPGCGPVRIGFAKEQSATNTPGANGVYPSPSPDPFVSKSSALSGNGMSANQNINAETAAAALVTPDLLEIREEVSSIIAQFGAPPDDIARMGNMLEIALHNTKYADEIPPIPEPGHARTHDAPRLREIRKRIDNSSCSPLELESIAMEMLPEVSELASDYLGNTVVQKLFENCGENTKEAMLAQIAPHLAEVGVHKNGTWAAQKIIDVARTPAQVSMIVEALRPHGVNLFLDQYGNYVMQCCLRFQAPANNFIFETMLARLWESAQGRFGARAMRACLESHFATSDQKRLMAAAITLHSVQLATNSNGALLLTWFLDTCTFPRRRSVLAPRLIPHLVHLSTHKVAYLTVLKIINQRNEPEARDSILRALFFDERVLQSIVSDQACGATFIFKVLTTPFLEDNVRPECVENVRNVLLRLNAKPSQGYKRLMDEVGLSTRHGNGTPVSMDGRATSKTRSVNGHSHLPHLDTNQNGYPRPGPYGNMTPQHDPNSMGNGGLQRTVSMDSTTYDSYNNNPNMMTPQYSHSPALSNPGINMSPSHHIPPQQQQWQQQQQMLAQQHQQQQQQQARQQQMNNFYPSPVNNSMQYQDPYRMQGVPPGMGYQPQPQQQQQQQMWMQQQSMGMGMQGYGQGAYGGPMGGGYVQQGQMAGSGGGGRRARR
ncbi:hypothetical protein B0A48_01944 [Cryoendolithus antarcticus]|uniref:PUM-HD domain-containing protein n=1 Tax=Cryoendolithus antarcticus TaxID=1507870 RepID=A0A1V8TQX5_9PEZI|nr:hypothetical protein B0A48_01944 [Cryoendolithus antarcticus]